MLASTILSALTLAVASSALPGASAVSVNGVFPRASKDEINQYLTNHNSVRSQHHAGNLKWDQKLADYAQGVANKCKFAHSGGPYGENLAAGSGGSYDVKAALKSWADEAPKYNPADPMSAGHFTQMVWKATTSVGCAMKECDGIFDPKFGKAKFYVCEYSPRGNVVGQYPQNVQM